MNEKWMLRHRFLIQHGVAILIFVLGVLLGFAGVITEKYFEKALIGFLVGTVVITAVLAFVLYYAATVWYFDFYLKQDERIYMEELTSALALANSRRDVLLSLNPEEMQYPILSVSSCNLFANPDGYDNETAQVVAANEAFFRRAAVMATTPGGNGRLRVLLRYDTEQQRDDELAARIKIMSSVLQGWDPNQFDIRELRDKSVKDYLVVEDHVFKTIRSPERGARGARYVHIESKRLAAIYREWLVEVFYSGHYGGLTEDPTTTREMFEQKIAESRQTRTQ